MRTLAVERILDLKMTGSNFEVPPDFDPEEFLNSTLRKCIVKHPALQITSPLENPLNAFHKLLSGQHQHSQPASENMAELAVIARRFRAVCVSGRKGFL